jgi:hypothetical protein
MSEGGRIGSSTEEEAQHSNMPSETSKFSPYCRIFNICSYISYITIYIVERLMKFFFYAENKDLPCI